MKKLIISAITAAALLFGFAGCSGDSHDAPVEDTTVEDTTILKEAALVGTMNGWSPKKMTKVNDTTYTYNFIASGDTEQFSIQEVSGKWDSRWCGNDTKGAEGDAETTKCVPGGDLQPMVLSKAADPTHVQLKDLQKNSEYKITVVINDPGKKQISCKIELLKAGEAPKTYSFEGAALKGGWEGHWEDAKKMTADKTQEFTTLVGKNDASGNEFGIFNPDNNWAVSNLELGKRTEMQYSAEKVGNSTMKEDWEVGATYKIKIELTDDSVSAPKAYITISKN